MDLDFTQSIAQEAGYDPVVARKCFEAFGTAESFAEMENIFVEGKTSGKMYYLVEGEVALIRNKKTIDIIKPGEIFGEIAVLTQQPRTASAMARKFCQIRVLNAGQFQQALQTTSPEFALMLMNIMNNRLRLTIALMKSGTVLTSANDGNALRVFDKKLMEELLSAFDAKPPQTFPQGRVIMKEGDAGASMYIVVRGTVAVSVKGAIVQRVGPGGTFGEMALVDKAARAATACAESECQLLAIGRNDFLNLVKTKPDFAIALLKTLAERLRATTAMKN